MEKNDKLAALAHDLARDGWALLHSLTHGHAWDERDTLERTLDRYVRLVQPGGRIQDVCQGRCDSPDHETIAATRAPSTGGDDGDE